MSEEMTVREKDMRAAKELEHSILDVFFSVDKVMSDIEKDLSGFNSPGCKVAFLEALRGNINVNTHKFNLEGAVAQMSRYLDRE